MCHPAQQSGACVHSVTTRPRVPARIVAAGNGTDMTQRMAEWLWRAAMLAAMAWIGWELQQIHQDLLLPAEDQTTAAASPDDTAGRIDELADGVASLNQKVDAIMIAMTQLKP